MATTPFITTWKTDNPGTSTSSQITIPVAGTGINYDVNWGDGNIDTGLTSDTTHTYSTPGEYIVAMVGTFPQIYFNGAGDRRKILSINQWGDNVWDDFTEAFRGCENLVLTAIDDPDLSAVTSTENMFKRCRNLIDGVSTWDTSNITNMSSMFEACDVFDDDLNTWDVSSVTDMSNMFMQCYLFNSDLDTWDVSNVTDMSFMFAGAYTFNKDITGWDVSSVSLMTNMFASASLFNQPIGSWTTSSLTNIENMFGQLVL